MKIGLALGSGSARGWAHIGIIETLIEHGIVPDVVTGTSIGSIVGASYASGHFEDLKRNVLGLNKLKWTTYFSPSTSIDGWVNHRRMQDFLIDSGIRDDLDIADMAIPYGCVACDYETGHEKWFTRGSLSRSVWASMAMPGLFPAVNIEGHWYIDGGIINPVPVSLCRALGADLVIAVNLNADILARRPEVTRSAPDILERVKKKAGKMLAHNFGETTKEREPQPPSAIENMARSVNIAQDIITRSRLAGDPPDILMTPRLSHVGLIETYRGAEGIEEGRRCCERLLPMIEDLIGQRKDAGY